MGEVQDDRDAKKTFVAPAVKSFEHYDFSRAKICCSLRWIVSKAYGTDSIPADLKDPFYTDQYEQEHLKPPVASLLLSADLYCRAGSLILKSDAAKPLLGHDAVIQALAQRGLYVTDQERLVTERDLRKRPLQMSAHLAMIDTLMMAYTVETVSAEKVMTCLYQYSSCSSEVETPYDTEDAVTTWVNKVNEYLKEVMAQDQKKETQSAEQTGGPRSPTKWYMKLVPARYRKEQASTQPPPWIPPVDNLLKDSTDGSALGALLHFYCPQVLPLDEICLKENMTLADRLYNLQLIQDFCKDNLNSCCHFSLEDMLYASSAIKSNYLVFMAELFWWFEVVKPSFVKPRMLDNEGIESSVLKNIPAIPISKVTKRSFMERPPSPERPSLPLRPQPRNSGEIKRSTSMSFVDGNLGTWPKEKRSGPYGVSFDIPFDKEDSTKPLLSSARGMVRSVSTDDGSGFKVHHMPRGMKRNLSFQPVNGQSVGIEEEGCPDSLAGMETNRRPFPNGHGNVMGAAPSMDEALHVVHSPNRPPVEGINNGFFLHKNHEAGVGSLDPLSEVDSKELLSTTDTTGVDTGIHIQTEDMLDEDSSLKDCSVNMELDVDTPSPGASSQSKSPSAVKMTSFAEQKMRKLSPSAADSGRGSSSSMKTTPEGSEFCLPLSVSWAPTPEHSPVHQQATPPVTVQASPKSVQLPPNDPAQVMATEMVQLKLRLEEKRKAIEAQKKKVEAAFTRHRQKMGHSAFLNVVKRKADGAASGEDGVKTDGEGKSESTTVKFGRSKADTPDGAEQSSSTTCWKKSPGAGEEGGQSHAQLTELDLAEYTRSIEKLNHSLAFLQAEMQRLSQQQEVIMAMREQQHQQAWVIPPPHTNPSPQKHIRAVTRSSGPSSPADSPRSTHRSPTSIKRKSASFHSRNPRTARPTELKLAPYSRVLKAPQSVDSIPRLRRFSPCQPLVSSFIYMGEKPTAANPETVAPDGENNKETESLVSPERELVAICAAISPPSSPSRQIKEKQTEVDTNAQETEDHSLLKTSDVETDDQNDRVQKPFIELKPTIESSFPEVLSHPVVETFTLTPTEIPSKPESSVQAKSSLVEVPLSVVKPPEDLTIDEGLEADQGNTESLDDEQRMCRGFFFKEDGKAEENMAQKRAALLEKRMRREKENQLRKMQLETELEQKKEEARLKAEEERVRKEEDKARKEFIKQEYLRRKQLKLMEDMDTVIKPRAAGGAKQRRARPKSIHRDSMDSPKTPARAATGQGSRQRVFSVSSLSLASLNLGDSDSVHSEKRAPRPDSADGFLSPSRSSSRNGEKDWENASTTSSVTSNTEYTGPRLYKEPSAKSNKHIIQNALAHCCLAGKVNEGQKNKILEEMEKSEANNFLVLFRDSGCQFRSLYTYCPEMEEINRLTGIGPKSITRKMIDGLYKYNSDKKQFSQIPAKTMSASVDAVTIHNHLWQTKKPATPKKVVPVQS